MIKYRNATRAAEIMGITRNTLHNRVKKGIVIPDGLFIHGNRNIPIYSEELIASFTGFKIKPGRKTNDQIKVNK